MGRSRVGRAAFVGQSFPRLVVFFRGRPDAISDNWNVVDAYDGRCVVAFGLVDIGFRLTELIIVNDVVGGTVNKFVGQKICHFMGVAHARNSGFL